MEVRVQDIFADYKDIEFALDKLSLNLKFNPQATAISLRSERQPMKKTVFTQYNLSECSCTEQGNARPDDTKTFFDRPLRCAIAFHRYSLTQRDTDQSAKSAYLSCVQICIGDSHSQTGLHNYEHVTLNMIQKSELPSSAAFIAETTHAIWNLQISIVSHVTTFAYMMIPAIKASKKGVWIFFKRYLILENGLRLIHDNRRNSGTMLFRMIRTRFLSCVSCQIDNVEKPA